MSRVQTVFLLVFGFLVALSHHARAQELIPAISRAQVKELQAWVPLETEWRKWYEKWGTRALAQRELIKRRPRPEPPAWLPAECLGLIGGEGILVEACNLMRDVGKEGGLVSRTVIAAAGEKPTKTTFLERVHVGGGWPLVMASSTPFRYGALFETHVSIFSVGPVEVNSPGVALIALPDRNGRRRWKVAGDIGVSVRFRDFKIPGTTRHTIMYLNLSNAFVSQVGGDTPLPWNSVSLIGLSATFKK